MLGKMIKFAIPLMLTGTLQLLYNAADIIVVGQFAGTESLSAVGSTGAITNLMINIFLGLSVGTSVVVSKYFGARDYDGMVESVHTSIGIAVIAGIFVAIFGFIATPSVLELMNTPEDVIDKSILYMRIYFLGMPFNMLYNFGAAILRAVGDTKRPLLFLSISGIINVLLNLLLVIVFKMDVAGVAIATITAQAISMVLVLRCLIKSDGALKLYIKKIHIYKEKLIQIAKIGLPAGIQGSLFSVSNVLIQSTINSFGAVAMAGNAAASNLEGFVYVSMNTLHQTDITFASQNFGAKKYKRVRKCLWICLALVAVIGLAVSWIVIGLSQPLISLYNSDPAVIEIGKQRLLYICSVYFICGMMDVLVGQLRGIGSSIIPMFVTLGGVCGLRVLWIYFVCPIYPSLECVYLSYPITWTITALGLLICYLITMRKFPKHDLELEN